MKKEELNKMWEDAACPEVGEISGVYKVKRLTGKLALMNLPGDRKICNAVYGWSEICGIEYGDFNIRQGLGCLIFNYDNSKKVSLLRRVKQDLYIVRHFRNRFSMKHHFFLMKRLPEERLQ